MERVEVKTQAELDAALKRKGVRPVCVGTGRFVVGGSSTVDAGGSSTVDAGGSSTVYAGGSSTVDAGGSSTVYARGSSTVYARGSSTVDAGGSSTVYAGDSSTVSSTKYTAIHKDGDKPKITGDGHVIQMPDLSAAEAWLENQGVEIVDGNAILFKAVGDDYRSPHGMLYEPGSTPECTDWSATASCGNGLHFSPRPAMARDYNRQAKRYVACPVAVADLVVIDDWGRHPDKVKAPRVAAPCWEVDRWGRPIENKTGRAAA